MNFAESKTSPSSIADSQGPRFEADGRGAAGKGPEAKRTAEVWEEGAGRSATSEAEREKGYVGPGKEYPYKWFLRALGVTLSFPTQVKKFRKGQTDTIDFLEDGGGKGKKSNKKDQNQA